MTTTCRQYQENWDLLVLGALDPDLQEEMNLHLRTCPACQADFLESEAVISVISTLAPDVYPSKDAERRLLSRIDPGQRAETSPRRSAVSRWAPWMAAAACLVGMVWMGADRIVLKSRLEAAQREAASLRGQVFEAARARSQAERKAASLQQTVEQLRAGSADAGRAGFRIASLERDLQYQVRQAAEYRSMLQVLESRSMRQLELKVVDPAGGKATARAMWSADGGLLFLAHDLPDLGKEKCYQLWVLRRKEPAVLSAGLVSLDAKGNGLLYVPPDPGMELVNGFAITDEPKGGSVVARGKKLLVGVE